MVTFGLPISERAKTWAAMRNRDHHTNGNAGLVLKDLKACSDRREAERLALADVNEDDSVEMMHVKNFSESAIVTCVGQYVGGVPLPYAAGW